MKRCDFCFGHGVQHISHGSTERGEYRDCDICEGFGQTFDSPDEKRLFILLTTEEEREGHFENQVTEENYN